MPAEGDDDGQEQNMAVLICTQTTMRLDTGGQKTVSYLMYTLSSSSTSWPGQTGCHRSLSPC